MMPPAAKKGHIAERIIAVVAALCLLLIVLIHIHPGHRRYARAVTPFFILHPDSVVEESIPDYAGIRRTYTFTLPESDTATTTGACLSAYLRHTWAQIRIEGGASDYDLSEDARPHIGHTPGSYWISIPLRPGCGGKTARVTLTPVYAGVRDEVPTFMVITRDALFSKIELPKDALLLSLGCFAAVSGLFLMLTSLVLPLEAMDRRHVFHIGAVAVLAGLWKLCGLPVLALMLDDLGIQKELWYTGAVSYVLMLVLSLRIAALTDNRPRRLGFCLSAALAALLVVMQMAGVWELHEALIWYGVVMAILHILSLLAQKPVRRELVWLCPFFLTLGADLVIYRVTGSMRAAPCFLIWLILHLFARGFGFVRQALRRESLLRTREAELRDSRVQSMMNQIQPHFIYNTLTTIHVLCRDDPGLAMQVIQDFTTYLQANFTAISATDPIAFSDELEHTRAYIAVESLRYGDRLHMDYDLRHTAFRLPPLTLQPLVENAVKHGLGRGVAPEHILVATRAEEGQSVIVVADDGPGIGPGADDSEVHVGLQNVRQRLELMCGGTLRVENASGGGTIVTITIPPAPANP